MTFQEFFETNRILFYSLYGQVFFVLGLTIAVTARQDTRVPLARPLWLLSAFGFLHAFYEWSYVILPVQKAYLAPETYRVLEIFQRPVEAVSFAFLLQFGISVIALCRPTRWLHYAPATIFAIWLLIFFYAIPPVEKEFKPISDLADLWARYLLCFPGACLTAYGLILQTGQAKDMGVHQIERHLRMAALSFLLYAVVAGLLVPPASFFPASWLNRRLFSSYFGVPSPVTRAIAGMLIAYFMIRSLEVFRLELRRRLEEASRAWALAQERERISRDLHDGILQHLYGAGLCLENSLPTLPQNSTATMTLIQKSIDLLNRGMQDIRSYIFDLNWGEETDLKEKLKNLLLELNANGEEPKIQLETLGSGTLKLRGSIGLHLYHFIQEAITNTRKHANAKNLLVKLVYSNGALKVTIEDDGVGFLLEEAWQKSSVRQQGIRNMKRRAELLGGEFEIETQPARGTRISLTLLLGTRDHERAC